MDDDGDRSCEATQLEEISMAEETNHHDVNDDEISRPVSDEEDDEETDDQRDFSTLAISSTSAEEDSRVCRSSTLKSDLSDVPVNFEMRRDELEHLKNQLQGSHQEALAIVIAQAAQAHSRNQINVAEADQKDAFDSKSLSASCSVTTPIDAYNWRKYGQKLVKSPEGSRSYYKCSNSECDAKKIESCDKYNSVTKVVYKGQHKHDPPKKESSPKALKRKSISTPGSFQIEQRAEPKQKQRVKKSSSVSPGSVLQPPKKPKFIVHAAVDIQISADGYRWRKYGQKMVKGNPHPRNYYKCTSAGCPVRKHIEKATDGSSEVIITYKGVHDHDMPVPKKRHGPPSGLLIAAARSNRTEPLSNHGSTTEPPLKKTDEPARTLLSVGFEIKHC